MRATVLPPAGTLYLTPGTIIAGQPQAQLAITGPSGVLTISTGTDVALTASPAQEGFAASRVNPPQDARIPPPADAAVPPYVQG